MTPRHLVPAWLVALLVSTGYLPVGQLWHAPSSSERSYPLPTGGDGSRRARRKAAKRRNKARADRR